MPAVVILATSDLNETYAADLVHSIPFLMHISLVVFSPNLVAHALFVQN